MKKILFAALFGIPAALLVGVLYQQWGIRRDRRRFVPPGRLVRCGDASLHIYESGEGEPVVVLESGLASSCLSWTPVGRQLSERTRVVSYDRAGIGWSDETGSPRTLSSILAELSLLLRNAGARPPYILVGHSFGALLVRAFAHSNPVEVAGLVLIDPVSLDFWADCGPVDKRRLQIGARLSRRGAWLANLGIVRLALWALTSGNTNLAKGIGRISASKASTLLDKLVGIVKKLPPALWPAVCSHWSQAKSFRAMADYLERLPEYSATVRRFTLDPELPVAILSAADATASELTEWDGWAAGSRRGKHIRIPKSSHWIQLEQPNEVVAAVTEMLDHVSETGLTVRSDYLSN